MATRRLHQKKKNRKKTESEKKKSKKSLRKKKESKKRRQKKSLQKRRNLRKTIRDIYSENMIMTLILTVNGQLLLMLNGEV